MKKTLSLIFTFLLTFIAVIGVSAGEKTSNTQFTVQIQTGAETVGEFDTASAVFLRSSNSNSAVFFERYKQGFNPTGVESQRRYSLKVTNNTAWDIYRLYMSSAEEDKWGPDQLGDFVLSTGRSFTVTDIIPGEYDIMFVDEDNDKCSLRNVQIFQNKDWSLTSSWLVKCQEGNDR